MNLPKNASYLKAARRNQLALLKTTTKLKLSKEKKLLIGKSVLYKEHTRTVFLNCNYLELENKARAAKGLQPLKNANPLPWGEWAIKNVLIKHSINSDNADELFYLRYYINPETDVNDKVYRLDNVIIPEDEARKLLCNNDRYKACCRVVSWDNIDELYLLTKDGEIDVTVK